MAQRGLLSRLLRVGLDALTRSGRSQRAAAPTGSPGQFAGSATVEVDPHTARGLQLDYAPSRDGDPDAGEIVWTWVPYAERDGRGKDRPVLVIARHAADRVYAVKLTSRPHGSDRGFVPIGAGAWDHDGRESWVDIDQLYSVHRDGMRREAAALDVDRYSRVVLALQRRFGWQAG
ncbi:MAG: type II toxin-antitoxin system PemK/MazF family toxin [Microbacterium sp.]